MAEKIDWRKRLKPNAPPVVPTDKPKTGWEKAIAEYGSRLGSQNQQGKGVSTNSKSPTYDSRQTLDYAAGTVKSIAEHAAKLRSQGTRQDNYNQQNAASERINFERRQQEASQNNAANFASQQWENNRLRQEQERNNFNLRQQQEAAGRATNQARSREIELSRQDTDKRFQQNQQLQRESSASNIAAKREDAASRERIQSQGAEAQLRSQREGAESQSRLQSERASQQLQSQKEGTESQSRLQRERTEQSSKLQSQASAEANARKAGDRAAAIASFKSFGKGK